MRLLIFGIKTTNSFKDTFLDYILQFYYETKLFAESATEQI
jgi:hypothetical protein